MALADIEIRMNTRLCKVKGELGIFHIWEQYSAGNVSRVFGIVEFSDRVKRVDPTNIVFCDEQNEILKMDNGLRNDTLKEKETITKKEPETALCTPKEYIQIASALKTLAWHNKNYLDSCMCNDAKRNEEIQALLNAALEGLEKGE